ncbi:ATPase PAAT isoform X3 [Eptesicus fuscus]|uniref:ATPase PAAT isoform X3 n=1 Tax=Eptesicus fuscus TaxID=29078 RepID=UPI0024048C70|nr:ATPase PAAT isoform X3 [Eptesicus fuscus]
METETEDERSATHPTLASSWDAACGALGRSLRVRRAQDSDWDELLAPPSSGRDLVSLKRSRKSPDEEPCFLSLSCGPSGGEEVVSVGILSSARNMEVYLGEEYCGTSRGRRVGNVLDSSEHGKIILYKKFLKLESAAQACKIKLLSFGERPCVFVSKVVAHVRPGPAKPPASCPALGSRVDLERVHTMVAAVGSTLSPGAQQLMSMVRLQQQRCIPLGEQLQAVLGSAACKRVLGLRASAPSGACDGPTCAPAPLRAGLTSGRGTEDRASDSPGAPAPELLPILQDVCGQVRRLRGPQSAAWPGHVPAPSEGGVGAGMGEPPACSYLEKILSKKLELMERRLTDHLDERLRALQEHIDGKVALLARSLQSPGSPPPGLPLTRCDSGDGLSNGER